MRTISVADVLCRIVNTSFGVSSVNCKIEVRPLVFEVVNTGRSFSSSAIKSHTLQVVVHKPPFLKEPLLISKDRNRDSWLLYLCSSYLFVGAEYMCHIN